MTTNGDIYIDNGESNGRVDRRSVNASISIPIMQVNSACQGLFIDQNDTFYCSIRNHQVMKKYLNDNSSQGCQIFRMPRKNSDFFVFFRSPSEFLNLSEF